ncbi:PREDICTED: kelch-like protein 24 [Branchiostoma belcheri]|uniref:Kelch-like protein 24 n=1 Tax=Branchiostoma belcheri TaxID=7741 RepID=A0A6P4YHY3_BRABE|nr:PREDICTED: kelch-like protein 24 [Branchiostoma belcheri]
MMAAGQTSLTSFNFCHEPHSGTLLQGLEGLRSNSLLVDVILCVAGKEIPCHRNVLAACSGYFRALFCNGLRESKEDKVTIQEVSTSTLQLLVDYAYTSKVTITEHNAVKLLEGANFFQIQPVFDACTTFLSEHLCAQNCLSMLDLGGMLSPDLEKKALPYAMKEFTAVSKTPEFLYLRKDQLVTLISSDNLNASEETVYTAVMAWINHDTRKRRKEMKELMELVRFPFMDKMYFMEKVETNNAIRKSCPDIVSETRRYQLFPGEVQSPRTRPRRVSGLREAVVVIGGAVHLKQVEVEGLENTGPATCPEFSNSIMMTSSAEPSGSSWVPLTTMKQDASYGFAAAVLGTSDIIVSAGERPRVGKEVWLYNVELDNWAKLAPMNVTRAWHKLAVLQGKVYAIGGKNSVSPALRSVEVYDRHLNKWSDGVSLPEPRRMHAVAVLDGNIYVIGGSNDENKVSTVYRISPGDTEWHPQSDIPVACGNIPASVLNGNIYVVGPTLSYFYTMYCFTPGDNGGSWSEVVEAKEFFVSLTHTRSFGMTVFGGKLYICGGRSCHTAKKTVYCFDPEAKSVKFVGTMSKGLFSHACVTVLKGDRE